MPRALVVGAGISGLALAYRLQQLAPTVEVLVLEQGHVVRRGAPQELFGATGPTPPANPS